jgi:hypothetical protein
MLGIGFILTLFLVSPTLAAAQERVQVNGVILSLNMCNNAFFISEQFRGDQRYWIARRTGRTKISIGSGGSLQRLTPRRQCPGRGGG